MNTAKPLEDAIQQGLLWQGSESVSLEHSTRSGANKRHKGLTTQLPILDELLPEHGWPRHALVEIQHTQTGLGELSLVMPTLAKLSQHKRWILWVAPPLRPNAHALAQQGLNLDHLLFVYPKDNQEALWCMEEGLKSGSCSAVLGWPQQVSSQDARRLQVAAGKGRSQCWLWLDAKQQCSSNNLSPAALKLALHGHDQHSINQSLDIEILKRRGAWPLATRSIPMQPMHA